MAPVSATAVGIARQTIDDPTLVALLERLSKFAPDPSPDPAVLASERATAACRAAAEAGEEKAEEGAIWIEPEPNAVDVEGLAGELERLGTWRFQEQADLYEWIKPLDAIDAALTQLVREHPSLLLIGPPPCDTTSKPIQAESVADVASVPPAVLRHVKVLLRFLCNLLRNATYKSVFNSVLELSDLLAAADDEVAALALEALANLSTPPQLHRQQAPETSQHSTALHNAHLTGGGRYGVVGAGGRTAVDRDRAAADNVHSRLVACARGWGSRGCGLGLASCVAADDSPAGRASLGGPAGAGTYDAVGGLSFEYFVGPQAQGPAAQQQPPSSATAAGPGGSATSVPAPPSTGGGAPLSSRLVRVRVSPEEIMSSPPRVQPEKRRRTSTGGSDDLVGSSEGVVSSIPSSAEFEVRSTSELFFLALERAGGRGAIPTSRLFSLLSEVRLARSFHRREDRIAAVERRMRALVAMLQAHPSQDVVGGYFAAQPELVSELCDLIRPTVSSAAVSSAVILPPAQDCPSVEGSALSAEQLGASHTAGRDAISAVADPPASIPYAVRTLAIEVLTALVARRDPSGSNNAALKQATVLAELGVGKGQFLGLLPALIRYTLASLNSFLMTGRQDGALSAAGTKSTDGDAHMNIDDDEALGLSLGLAFVDSTRSPPPPRHEEEERALEFVDAVLTLTSAVVSVPSGTTALTECGLIPALVSTVALDSSHAASRRVAMGSDGESSPLSPAAKVASSSGSEPYVSVLLNFITAQAVQILEGAIVTHGNALSAFRDLGGVDLLVKRLTVEIGQIRQEGGESASMTTVDSIASDSGVKTDGDGDVTMEDAEKKEEQPAGMQPLPGGKRPMRASRRVLLFSIVNCLTVVFHQQETASGGGASSAQAAQSSGAAQLRRPELTDAVRDIMEHVTSYGGVLAALAATLLSDVMNADPQVVRYVHGSGLAKSFLSMFLLEGGSKDVGDDDTTDSWVEPTMPASSELIMAVPNVLSALALTEDGATAIKEANPFPSLLAVFCSPQYAMPTSRCLLNEMASIVGTGLDEIMRHVPSLRPLVISAVVRTVRRVAKLGRESEMACSAEEAMDDDQPADDAVVDESAMNRLAQYASNVGQILEQILHTEEHVSPFVEAGGLDSAFDLYPLLVPGGKRLLAQISCLSCPSISSMAHTNMSGTLTMAIKNIASSYDCHKLMTKIIERLEKQLEFLVSSQKELRTCAKLSPIESADGEFASMDGLLDGIPSVPMQVMEGQNDGFARLLSRYLKAVGTVEWLTGFLSSIIRAAIQRSHDMGGGWGRTEREWKKEISSDRFGALVDRLGALHRSCLLEVCRARTEPDYELREAKRRRPPGSGNAHHPAVYRLRIVCPEGAVVRDGIEINPCASVGGLEMGEVVEAYDRCINSSGVMRYRTRRGWVSEQTRGHGREPIAEVLAVRGIAGGPTPGTTSQQSSRRAVDGGENLFKRVECGIADLRSASASILTRLHGSQRSLFACLGRAVVLGVRAMPQRSISFQPGAVNGHVASVVGIMSRNLEANLSFVLSSGEVQCDLIADADSCKGKSDKSAPCVSKDAMTLYLGSMLNLLHSCLYEEKRERHVFNILLLISLMRNHGFTDGLSPEDEDAEKNKPESKDADLLANGMFGAVRYVLKRALDDMDKNASMASESDSSGIGGPTQRVSRYISASLPPAVSLLRRLMSRSLLVESQMSAVLTKMKGSDLETLLDPQVEKKNEDAMEEDNQKDRMKFHPARFGRSVHCVIASLSLELWTDGRLTKAPANVLHPVLQLLGTVLNSLELSVQSGSGDGSSRGRSGTAATVARAGNSTGDPPSDLFRAMNAFLGGGAARLRDMGGAEGAPPPPPPPFEPSEETITHLTEMGFSRDHALEALESTESNRVEVAMEYCLSHPPPSPQTIERRRAARDERRRQREEAEQRRDEQQRGREGAASSGTAAAGGSGSSAEPSSAADAARVPLPPESEGDSGSGPVATSEGAATGSSGSENREESNEGADTSGPGEKAKDMEVAEDGKEGKKKKPPEERSITRIKQLLQALKDQLIPLSFDLIEGGALLGKKQITSSSYAYGEPETVTVVICFFLLDCCERYPEFRCKIVSEALDRLKQRLNLDKGERHCRVMDGQEETFSAMCHACVILLRALPRTRVLVLKEGLVGCFLGCIKAWSSARAKSPYHIPRWLSPALLLLDVMAQPTAVPIEVDSDKKAGDKEGKTDPDAVVRKPSKEMVRVSNEHKKQSAHLSKAASQIFAAVNNEKPARTSGRKKKSKEKEPDAQGTAGTAEPSPASESAALFTKIPTYQPLIPAESAEVCLSLCLQVLRICTKNGNQVNPENASGKAGSVVMGRRGSVVHASLLLLTRVLRSHKLASLCLKLGGAELILSMPAGCRFQGNTGLVTIILRRMLEDEQTLQTAMETEIRATVSKLHKKQSRGSASPSERPSTTSRSFMQAVTPLICRDPVVFIKAAATSVRLETPSTDSSGSNRQSARVVLLSTSERAKNLKALTEHYAKTGNKEQRSSGTQSSVVPSGGVAQRAGKDHNATPSKRGRQVQRATSAEKPKASASKSPHRSSLSRRSLSPKKGGKKELFNPKKLITLNGSPANHVTSLLLSAMMACVNEEKRRDANLSLPESFLWLIDYLEIVADLILAVPACAAAIHRYRPSVKIQHALSRCPPPPNTAVSFFLHELLPQPRVVIPKQRVDAELETGDSKERTNAYMKVKISQTTARLLVALVARAGEGRRRVIADLSFALSGAAPAGTSKSAESGSSAEAEMGGRRDEDHEMWALQSWGELCIGIAAPRSTGISQDTNSSLSWEVVKLMLESSMAHALLSGMRRVKLHHPNAASCAASLIRPLEVFTRGSVTDTVTELAEKAAEEKKAAAEKASSGSADDKKPAKKSSSDLSLTRSVTIGPSQQNEAAFADDAMLEDGFDAETAERTARRTARQRERAAEDDPMYEDVEGEEVEDEEMENEDASVEDEESDMSGNSDDDDMSSDDDIDDDVSSDVDGDSMDSSDEVSSESEGEDDETEELDEAAGESAGEESEEEPDDGTEDEEEVDEMEEDGIDDDFERDAREEEEGFFDGAEEDDGDEDAEPDDEGDAEEPWAFFGRNAGPAAGGRRAGRQAGRGGGFMVEAAEAMIGNILREGGLQMEALAELEDTLGVRIIQRGSGEEQQNGSHRVSSTGPRSSSGDGSGGTLASGGDALSPINRGPIGSAPSVHQGLPPDSGFSSVSSRAGDSNQSMEYLYGGPAVMSGSECYDLGASTQEDDRRVQVLFPVPATVDTQLFPGGPAASMHARTQQHIHPYLCGIELSPFNAIIPAQSHQLGQSPRGSRSGGSDWGSSTVVTSYMSGGQVLRITRGPSGQLLESSRTAGATGGNNTIVGWTDDGQPLDSTASDFGVAFEQALSETIAQNLTQDRANTSATSAAGDGSNQGGSAGGQEEQTTSQGEVAQGEPDGNDDGGTNEEAGDAPNDSSATGPDSGSNVESAAGAERPSNDQSSPGAPVNPTAGSAAEANASEGEVVASSLATGLRLSPSSENSASSDPMSTGQGANDVANEESGTRANEQASEEQDRPNQDESEGANQGNAEEATGDDATNGDTGEQEQQERQPESHAGDETGTGVDGDTTPSAGGLVCPAGMDLEVFNSLPTEMQREVVAEHQATSGVAAQLDATSSLDPEALAALPEEMRREVIEQEQQERRMREEPPADPSNAQEMDNASFVASLAPDLREEILLTADEAFLTSLPPDMQSEAQILRERAATSIRRRQEQAAAAAAAAAPAGGNGGSGAASRSRGSTHSAAAAGAGGSNSGAALSSSNRKRQRSGKMRVDCDRSNVIYIPSNSEDEMGTFMTEASMTALVKLMYLLSPVRPQKLLQKLIQNLCASPDLRKSFISTFVSLLNDDTKGALLGVKMLGNGTEPDVGDFPPLSLIGTAPEVGDIDASGSNVGMFRRRPGGNTAASIAANLPVSARGSLQDEHLPPVVAKRLIDTLQVLTKGAPRTCLDVLGSENTMEIDGIDASQCLTHLERLLDLLERPLYSKSATNLEQLLTMLESAVSPLSLLPKDGEQDAEVSKRELDAAAAAGKEYVEVPRTVVSPRRLQLLCSLLRLESCRDSSFVKVNTIARRLCRVEANRTCILRELASVAQGLGADAIRDLRSLSIRLNDAVKLHREKLAAAAEAASTTTMAKDGAKPAHGEGRAPMDQLLSGTPSSAVTLSTSSSEIKLLRVLQTLHVLCGELHDDSSKKHEGNHIFITRELVDLLQSIDLESLWDQLTSCLRLVSVLEGVSHLDEIEEKKDDNEDRESDADQDEDDQSPGGGKKLQNSVVGLLTRFLPTIEAFFVVNASSVEDRSAKESTKEGSTDKAKEGAQNETASPAEGPATVANESKPEEDKDADIRMLVGGKRLVEFVGTNKVLLNALLRSNPTLLEKSLRAMVQVPRCRPFLDFDVKRHWFKAHVRRLRQHAGRRYGSLRLHIRRRHVFEDAFHQLQLRNADEMRGRLHITFRNEEGVDAGGLSREFFAILAKEMFNPNYALFTSTEDGCTFQPNPNSSINPDHLSYFRFVGRIVGKAVLDGFLLDAHFTRSLYKHMLGVKPTHHDMEAIDPDYYRNLKTILEHDLDILGLELTFSIDEHIFGRSQSVNLIENGSKTKVTEENKAKYVSLVCQHRMTTAIKAQLKAFLDGFHELVKPDLISIFTAKELELLISGMPDIDIHDLKKNTDYNGYRATDKEIGWFWNIMFSLSRSEKAAFLQFVTGSSKVPLNGFSELQGMRGIQKFSIHKVGGSSGALMSAHTCFNSLDLPVYKSEEEMKEKLVYAISEGAGAFMFA